MSVQGILKRLKKIAVLGFNTSYVSVQELAKKQMATTKASFNTSYVSVQVNRVRLIDNAS